MNIIAQRRNALMSARRQWRRCLALMRKLDPKILVRPNDAETIFTLDETDSNRVRLQIKPVVLWTEQKVAGNKNSARIYIVITGLMDFGGEQGAPETVASWFSTQLAYFRERGSQIEHCLGAHYDFDNKLAHPIFHAQIKSQEKYWDSVVDNFPSYKGQSIELNSMKNVVSNVRFPTAQMDFFAVLLQVCSDHLINEKFAQLQLSAEAGKTNGDIYLELLESCGSYQGFGRSHPGFNKGRAVPCLRSHYWYQQA